GGTLRDVVQREAPLDPRRAVELTMKLADALNFGHTRGIVHCDVKPGNVLLGDQGEPKIVDFGIARSLTATADLSDTIAGTVGYISPEQVEGSSIDGRADVYSLAAVLYEMLTGTPPYSGDNLMAVATQRLVKPPASVREKNPFVPEDLNEIVMRGLARDPGARYPTAKAFADDLRNYLSSLTDATTRRMARPAGAPTGDMTERISIGQRPAAGAPTQDAEAAGGRRGRTWLFVAIAGTLAAVVVALIVVLAVALADGNDPGPSVTVPQVTGERIDDATRRIQDSGLQVGDVTLRSDQAPFGQVIEQRPAAGDPLESDKPVELIVSVGAEPP
ncbi:MAG: protein kinase domain-containing protein, partial [Dehalococcoidia bacterium]